MMRASRSALLDDDGKTRAPKILLPVCVSPPFGRIAVGRLLVVGLQHVVLYQGTVSWLFVFGGAGPSTTQGPQPALEEHQAPTNPRVRATLPAFYRLLRLASFPGIIVSNQTPCTYSHPHAADFLGP